MVEFACNSSDMSTSRPRWPASSVKPPNRGASASRGSTTSFVARCSWRARADVGDGEGEGSGDGDGDGSGDRRGTHIRGCGDGDASGDGEGDGDGSGEGEGVSEADVTDSAANTAARPQECSDVRVPRRIGIWVSAYWATASMHLAQTNTREETRIIRRAGNEQKSAPKLGTHAAPSRPLAPASALSWHGGQSAEL